MGTVYAVEDHDLRRQVALKVLSTRISDDARGRILREARILARLEHPGVVPVHDVLRLPDGRIAYSMKLVQGQRLDEHLQRVRGLRERLRILERICEAVAFAHARGVIHRDLKPSNVMVGPFGEVLVMDWGVAKLLDDAAHSAPLPHDEPAEINEYAETLTAPGLEDGAAGHTRPGTILGTPGFMSPEQRAGQLELVDGRTDVYALGVILDTLMREASQPAPRRLQAIAQKALAPLESRYANVDSLASDVSHFLDDGPVSAYRETPFETVVRIVNRYRGPIVLLLTYLILRGLMLTFAGD
jgi:serine/threonine-protein kinase